MRTHSLEFLSSNQLTGFRLHGPLGPKHSSHTCMHEQLLPHHTLVMQSSLPDSIDPAWSYASHYCVYNNMVHTNTDIFPSRSKESCPHGRGSAPVGGDKVYIMDTSRTREELTEQVQRFMSAIDVTDSNNGHVGVTSSCP